MANDRIFLGQFMTRRQSNPDTDADPYDPMRESVLENPAVLPNPSLVLSRPAVLPPIAPVDLSSPAQLPPPPAVTLGSPAVLPPPPDVTLSNPSVLPGPPAVTLVGPTALPPPPPVILVGPSVLPPPPAVTLTPPSVLPPPPAFVEGSPAVLPPPPNVTLSSPANLPPPPAVIQSSPATLPPPPDVQLSSAKPLPPPPVFSPNPNAVLPPIPEAICVPSVAEVPMPANVPDRDLNPNPNSGYSIAGERYSPIFGGSDAGSLAADPILYERNLERLTRLPPEKLIVHSMIQVGLFAQNIFGNVWNPAMIAPPPVGQSFMKPALDLPSDPDAIKERQLGVRTIVDAALDGTLPSPAFRYGVVRGEASLVSEPTVTTILPRNRLSNAFNRLRAGEPFGQAANSLVGVEPTNDPLFKSRIAFESGIIPMRLKGDNSFGFRTFTRGQGDQTDDDSVYVPLCFTDLRPIGDVFRTIYFRPIITGFSENLSPEWNKQQFFGRTDAVATYQSTGRSVSLSFKLIAFGPEDIRTIYQKLHWLKSMVYPEYDGNLSYRSGPVVRMRVGDAINALGPEGGRGLPGIIEGLDFDYTDAMWELKKGYKLPRHVDVSLSFTILHDVPIGRGLEGKFGGLGTVDENGMFSVKTGTNLGSGEQAPLVDRRNFHSFGKDNDIEYATLAGADTENI